MSVPLHVCFVPQKETIVFKGGNTNCAKKNIFSVLVFVSQTETKWFSDSNTDCAEKKTVVPFVCPIK